MYKALFQGDVKMNKVTLMKKLFAKLIEDGRKIISVQELIEESEKNGISEEDAKAAIEKLKRVGDLFEPKRGKLLKI